MINKLKTFSVSMVAGANIATVIIMLLTGFADYVNPVSHPTLSCFGMAFPIFLLFNLIFIVFWLIFKWRMAIIPIAGYVLASVPIRIYIPIHLPADMPDNVVKVLSYNVQNFSGAQRYDNAFDLIYDYLKQCDADIVCLQENLMSQKYQKEKLDSLYEYKDTTHVGSRNINSVGIYSRFPIIRKERIEYTSKGNGSMAYYIKMYDDTVLVVNNHFETTHLSLDERKMYKEMLKGEMKNDTVRIESKKLLTKLGESAAMRAPQADIVHQYIEEHNNYPTIVCGDFNDNPISYTRRIVAKGLNDCYVNTGLGIGLSYNQQGFYVRIDNIMCNNDFTPYNCKVDNKIDASDHYPIFCWLKKREKP